VPESLESNRARLSLFATLRALPHYLFAQHHHIATAE
jgi:hypothetical protein